MTYRTPEGIERRRAQDRERKKLKGEDPAFRENAAAKARERYARTIDKQKEKSKNWYEKNKSYANKKRVVNRLIRDIKLGLLPSSYLEDYLRKLHD